MDDAEDKTYLFKPVQPLFPSLSAPYDSGKISVNLQFIIPGLHVAEKEKNKYSELIKKCLDDIWGSRIQPLKSEETEAIATLIEIAFYINESEEDSHRSLQNKSRLLIERFLGILSFSAGIKLCAKNIVPTIIGTNSNQMILIPSGKTEMPKVRFSIPNELCNSATLSNEIFSALFWLRRGLAESDPIDTYNAFMVLSVLELLNIFPLYSEIDQLRKSPYMVCDSCRHHGCPLHPFSLLLVYLDPQTFMRLNEMIYSEIDI